MWYNPHRNNSKKEPRPNDLKYLYLYYLYKNDYGHIHHNLYRFYNMYLCLKCRLHLVIFYALPHSNDPKVSLRGTQCGIARNIKPILLNIFL